MWGRYDTTAETAGILSGKVWNLDVWLEQAVSADGKQHNRGQEGAGLACVKLEANPGEEYMFRERALGSGAITEIFGTVQNHFKDLAPEQLHDAGYAKKCLPFAGEVYMGHLRYSTTGKVVSPTCIRSCVVTIGVPRIWHCAAIST